MTKQFTDKLDEILDEVYSTGAVRGTDPDRKYRQQILAAIEEVVNQQKWVDQESLDEIRGDFGISQSKGDKK